MTRRVVVTGMGTVCPVGNNTKDSFNNLVQGISGIDIVPAWCEERWAGQSVGVKIGGEVKNFNAEDFVEPKKDVKRMGRFIHLAIAASQEAWLMAGLPDRLDNTLGNKSGCVIGVGMIGMDMFCENYDNLINKGPRRVSAFFIPGVIPNLAPGHIAIRRNLRLDNWAVVSACASGAHAIGEAFTHIKYGRADLVVAGGAESAMHPIAAAGFHSMHALCSSKNDDPKGASRPFDLTRDGFVMGEGAGILILEELEHALKRNAKIYGEIIGYGSSCDANHITAPAENGEGAQRSMRQALACASIKPSDVDYINAHGTSTPMNDKYETMAIKSVFGDQAKKIPISSTKSMTGHLLGAAGGIEAVFSLMSINNNIMPPTINLKHPDPECDLDYIPNIARAGEVNIAMSNSFGFGGANAVLVFKKYS